MAPQQHPGKSKQDYCTPEEFIQAVLRRLHQEEFQLDLAASKENTVTQNGWFDEATDALTQEWAGIDDAGWLWLNPPFGHLEPWVIKASKEASLGASIAMLVPASVGSNWWAHHVHNNAYVLFTRPRITFVGAKDPYPKDTALLLFQPIVFGGYDIWRWK